MPGFCLAVIGFPAVTIEQTREGGVWWISVCGMWSSAGSQPAATCRDRPPPPPHCWRNTAEVVWLKDHTGTWRKGMAAGCFWCELPHRDGKVFFFFFFFKNQLFVMAHCKWAKKMCQVLYLHVQKTVSGMRSGGLRGLQTAGLNCEWLDMALNVWWTTYMEPPVQSPCTMTTYYQNWCNEPNLLQLARQVCVISWK